MSNQVIDLKALSSDLLDDLEQFKADGVLPEIVYVHLFRAYNLGKEEGKDSSKGWWEYMDADEEFLAQEEEPFDEAFFAYTQYKKGGHYGEV